MRSGVCLHCFLGVEQTEAVDLYANINRFLFATDRTPDAFERAVTCVARLGFRSFKCAPFDEVSPTMMPDQMLHQAGPGLERVKAVRHALGPEASLLVDCHSRFSVQVAEMISRDLAALGVEWFEEPVHLDSTVDDLTTRVCNISMPVAGGESGYGVEFFNNLLEAQAVEVVMPDVKYCGGVSEAMCAGLSALRRGRQISLHSPTGPISLLASGHVMAAIKATLPLEYAVHEVEWRAELTEPTEQIQHGRLLLPSSAGLGVVLDGEAVKRYGYSWTP